MLTNCEEYVLFSHRNTVTIIMCIFADFSMFLSVCLAKGHKRSRKQKSPRRIGAGKERARYSAGVPAFCFGARGCLTVRRARAGGIRELAAQKAGKHALQVHAGVSFRPSVTG